MLQQNLKDKCYSMANIFSFAEKVIPDFKNKSEGDKFLFLYCITAKLLSNRLYDFESADDKIKCLLSRIPEDKKEDVEQLKKLLETFVAGKDFSVDKVKSFFDTNKDLLTSIYGNDKPSDLLLFFAQMQSKNIFKEENNKAFVNGMQYKNIGVSFTGYDAQEQYKDHLEFCDKNDICELNSQVVSKFKVDNALKKDPNRIFNRYLTDLDKTVGLNIFDKNKKDYEKRGFRLLGREQNCEQKDRDIYISQTLDIDKILKEKFSFKRINEMSKNELEKLNLSYDEEFVYFLASKDFSNEYIFQELFPFNNFKMPKDIKLETTLKIFYYFAQLGDNELAPKVIDYLKNKFETSQSLFDTCDKLKLPKDKLLKFFIGDPPKVKQILKCKDTKSPEGINKLLDECKFQDVIDCFVDTDDNKNQNLLSKYMLQYPEKLCNDLKYVHDKLDYLNEHKNKYNNDNKLKKLQNLMKSFLALKNAGELLNKCDSLNVINYFLDHDEGKEWLLKNIYNNVKELEYYFEDMLKTWKKLKNNENKTEQDNAKLKRLEYLMTKFLLDCKKEIFANNQKYIDWIIDMFNLQEKFCVYDLDSNKELDATDRLQKLLDGLIEKLGLIENNDIKTKNDLEMLEKNNEEDKEKNDQVIVDVKGKLYDLTKIYFCPFENASYKKYFKKNKYSIDNSVKDLQTKIKFNKKILESKMVSHETKQTVYLLARKYKEKLQETYNDFEKLVEDGFNDSINRLFDNFLNSLGIDQKTYDRLKNEDKDEMKIGKDILRKSKRNEFQLL